MSTGNSSRPSAVGSLCLTIRELLSWAEVREFAAGITSLPSTEYWRHGIQMNSGTTFPSPTHALPNGFRFPNAALDHFQRAAFYQAIERYRGPDPSVSQAFDRLQSLAWREGNEITPALIRRWTSELADHKGIALDAAQSLPVDELVELTSALMVPADHAGDEESAPPLRTADLDSLVRPHPPEPPFARLGAAALFVAEMLSTARLTMNDQRELLLSALGGLPRREGAVPGVDANGYRWAVRRMIEAGLVSVKMAPQPPRVRLSDELGHKRSGLETRDVSGRHVPENTTLLPPVPYLRSTPELWVRWRAGCMFPQTVKPLRENKKAKRPEENVPPVVEVAAELRRLEGTGISKPAEIIAYMHTPEGKALRSAVDAAKKAQPKKKRSGKPSSDSSIIAAAKQRNRRPNATS